jgi:hypothetical protein
MERHMTDDLHQRLRAARPQTADVDEHAFDAELLDRVRAQPIAARRAVPRAVALPVAAGVTLTATAVVMLGGGPGDVGGPSSASAIAQTLRWLDPPSGTILHARSIETMGTRTTIREVWQSGDDPQLERLSSQGATNFESAGDGLYDPATDTIYDATTPTVDKGVKVKPGAAKVATAVAPGTAKPAGEQLPPGDPIVAKVRTLLHNGDMTVTARERHNGTDAWAISLKPDVGRPVWTLWVSADDGKPLELRDPGRDANEQPQTIRWPTYEVLGDDDASRLLTLTGAHPSARVVHDAAQAQAAERRLMPPKIVSHPPPARSDG